jgi:hypothetical protein
MSEQTIAVATRESKQQSRSSQWILDLVVLWFVSLAISGAMLVDIGSRNPAYLHDFRININPDAGHYLVLGHNILENHVFSRASSPPFVPDALRTPVYPVVVGAVTAVWNEPLAVYALQMMLQLAVIGIVYAFCRIAFSRPIAIIAGTFVATDLAMAVGNFESMSEPVFVFLETAGVFVWICALRSEMSVRRRWYMMILSGILLGTATLTRPSGQFLPIVLGAAEAFYFARRRNWLAVRQLVCAVALSYVVVVPWCVRNHLVFGIPRTTYVDSVNLVHFVGASAYAVEHGTTLDEAQAQIEREFQLPKFAATYNYWKFGLRPKEIDAAYRTAAPQIVTRYPEVGNHWRRKGTFRPQRRYLLRHDKSRMGLRRVISIGARTTGDRIRRLCATATNSHNDDVLAGYSRNSGRRECCLWDGNCNSRAVVSPVVSSDCYHFLVPDRDDRWGWNRRNCEVSVSRHSSSIHSRRFGLGKPSASNEIEFPNSGRAVSDVTISIKNECRASI